MAGGARDVPRRPSTNARRGRCPPGARLRSSLELAPRTPWRPRSTPGGRQRTCRPGRPPGCRSSSRRSDETRFGDAIASASWADEVIVVFDAASVPADAPQGVRCSHVAHRGTGGPSSETWASLVRRVVISRSSTTTTSTRRAPRLASRAHLPHDPDGFTSSRCATGTGSTADTDASSAEASGRRCSLIPNDGATGAWTERYEGDFDFIISTMARHRRRPRFHQDIVAEIRPREGTCRS